MCKLCETFKHYQITFAAIILGLALVIAVYAGTLNVTQKGIYMTGSAEKIVKSDSAVWNITVNAKASTSAKAYNIIKTQTPVIINYLKSKGIPETGISVEPSNYWTSYARLPNGTTTDEISAYHYSQNIKVTSNDVYKIKTLSTEIQNLTAEGIDLVSSSPDYSYSGLANLKVSLLEAASVDAKNRAEAALKVNGNHAGKILSVRTGVFQITSPESTNVSDSGINDTSTIEKKVTAVVNVTFAVK